MLNYYDIGFDPGNSETSVVVVSPDGEQTALAVPSFVSRGSYSELQRHRSMAGREHGMHLLEVLQAGEHVLSSLDGEATEHFVGALALSQGRLATSGRGDPNRYWSPRTLLLLLTAAGTLIPDAEFGLHLVTGIPIETYSEQNRRKVRAALEGEHRFVLNGRERFASVHVEKVIMEGAGAMIAFGDHRSIRQAVMDIGGRTTDLYAADGQAPLIPLCRGTALGVELAADLLNQTMQTRYGRVLAQKETRAVLRAIVGSGQLPPIYVNGQEVNPNDLRQWAEEALRSVGRDIATFVSQTWTNSELGMVATDVAKVLLVGGGAYYFLRDIAPLIPHVTVPAQPELANALGYSELARQVRRRRENG
jgi:plasmid segregation protein ParM